MTTGTTRGTRRRLAPRVVATVLGLVAATAAGLLTAAPSHASAPAPAGAAAALPADVPAAAPAIPTPPIPGLPDCQGEPVPFSPDRGFQSYVTPTPADPPPRGDSPARPGSAVTWYEVSGLAGFQWHTYADACVRGPGQTFNQTFTTMANILMTPTVVAVGVVASLADAVYGQTWLQAIDEPVAVVSDAVYRAVTLPFFPLVTVLVAIVMIFSIRRLQISAALGTAGMVLVASTLAVLAADYPALVADRADDVTAGALTSINATIAGTDSTDPAVATVSPLVDAMLYDRWVAGTLGDTTSETARTYGPALFEASTLSWTEAEVVRGDPDGAGADLIEEKQSRWAEAASAVQESDPDAYEYLVGNRSADRVGHALVAFALIAILPFLLISLVLVGLSYVIIRVIIMFLPLVAIIALLVRGTLTAVLKVGGAALLNSAVFAVGASVTAYMYGVLLSPDSGLPAFVGILSALLVGIALWIILSPYRRLLSLVTGKAAGKQRQAEYDRVRQRALAVPRRLRPRVGGSASAAPASAMAADGAADGASGETRRRGGRDDDSGEPEPADDAARPETSTTSEVARVPGPEVWTVPPSQPLVVEVERAVFFVPAGGRQDVGELAGFSPYGDPDLPDPLGGGYPPGGAVLPAATAGAAANGSGEGLGRGGGPPALAAADGAGSRDRGGTASDPDDDAAPATPASPFPRGPAPSGDVPARRPELSPGPRQRDFDPVAVDGRIVHVLHTPAGRRIDAGAPPRPRSAPARSADLVDRVVVDHLTDGVDGRRRPEG